MAHVYIVSHTLKDAYGIFGLLHAILERRLDMEDLGITFIQPVSDERAPDAYDFREQRDKFKNFFPGTKLAGISHCPVYVRNGSIAWAQNVAQIIKGRNGPVCVFLDLGTSCDDRDTTALYRVLRNDGLENRVVLFTPWPDSGTCAEWKAKNACADFVVRRQDVTRARAVYVPMARRICDALEVGPY